MSYADRTKGELQEELRERGLTVSGTKEELVERLREDDDDQGGNQEGERRDDDQPDTVAATLDEGDPVRERTRERDEEGDVQSNSGHGDRSEQGGGQQAGQGGGSGQSSSEGGGQESTQQSGGQQQSGSGQQQLSPKQVVRRAMRHLIELSGRKVEGVAGFERAGDGWIVHLEAVEVHRVPSSTDVLGTYEVEVDRNGELLSYSRINRYVRGQAGGGDDE